MFIKTFIMSNIIFADFLRDLVIFVRTRICCNSPPWRGAEGGVV